METKALSRRDLLRDTGLMAIASATSGAVILGPDHVWALSTSSLDPQVPSGMWLEFAWRGSGKLGLASQAAKSIG